MKKTNEKRIFDYREPFNAPYMVREIVKNVRLPFVVYAQDFTVAVISFLVVGISLYLCFGINQLTVATTAAASYGMVQLFNKVEPDGKRVDLFLKDYLTYLFTFVFSRKVVYHECLEQIKMKKTVYQEKVVKSCIVSVEKEEQGEEQ